MPQTVREIMETNLVTARSHTPVDTLAELMRRHDIGAVPVVHDGELRGVVTDRDIVVRCIAMGRHPAGTFAGDLCSKDPLTVSPEDPADRAVEMMRQHALRRLPVTEGTHLTGMVSLGDLAVERDPESLLADISDAPRNDVPDTADDRAR